MIRGDGWDDESVKVVQIREDGMISLDEAVI